MQATRRRATVAERLDRRKRIDQFTGCWEWTGHISPNGYGRIGVDGKSRYTHRVSWELANGTKVPDGLVLDHVCENRRCFNPEHLEPVTSVENVNRAPNAPVNRTHCPQGHRYAGPNLRLHTDKRGYTHRICVTCTNIRNAQRTTAR